MHTRCMAIVKKTFFLYSAIVLENIRDLNMRQNMNIDKEIRQTLIL